MRFASKDVPSDFFGRFDHSSRSVFDFDAFIISMRDMLTCKVGCHQLKNTGSASTHNHCFFQDNLEKCSEETNKN